MAASSALFFKFLLKKNKHASGRAGMPHTRALISGTPLSFRGIALLRHLSFWQLSVAAGSNLRALILAYTASDIENTPPPPIHSSKRAIHAPRSAPSISSAMVHPAASRSRSGCRRAAPPACDGPSIVYGTGNPGVIQSQPVPQPQETRTRERGLGFLRVGVAGCHLPRGLCWGHGLVCQVKRLHAAKAANAASLCAQTAEGAGR
jgi:hypothetical protein